ncbi:hypothetical protein ACHAWF_007202 [Thalassiosira exigua]
MSVQKAANLRQPIMRAKVCVAKMSMIFLLFILPAMVAAQSRSDLRGTSTGNQPVSNALDVISSAEGGEALLQNRKKLRRRKGPGARNNAYDAAEVFGRSQDKGNDGKAMSFQTRIIGGASISDNEEHSYTVSIRDRYGNHYCGGTLVSRDCVLTAAHCTDAIANRGPITVVIGRRKLSDQSVGEELKVRREVLHPQFDNLDWRYDFAILLLRRPTLTKVKISKLNSEPYIPRRGDLVTVLGWGDIDPNEDSVITADELQEADLRILSNKQCTSIEGSYKGLSLSYSGFIQDEMMCAKNRRRDSCQGDSGGPLTYGGVQVGLISWGVGCLHRDFPGVYARISSAYGWISRCVCSMSMLPSAQFECEPR